MNISSLPNEILFNIFKKLPGRDLLECGRVCRGWECVVKGIGEEFWRQICAKDHSHVYKDAYRKSNLSWLDLYRSLNLWSEMRFSDLKVQETPIEAFQFHMQNGTIACPEFNNHCSFNKFNGVAYYDLSTLKVTKRHHFDFVAKLYKENESIIVLVDKEYNICVIPKAVMEDIQVKAKEFIVGQLTHHYKCRGMADIVLLENEVCFKDNDENFCISTIAEKDGKVSVHTESYGFFSQPLLTATRVNSNRINILTDLGHLFAYEDGTITIISFLTKSSPSKLRTLEKHGFKWTSPLIYKFLKSYDEDYELPKAVKSFHTENISGYGDYVIIGTSRCFVHIFKSCVKKPGDDEKSFFHSDDFMSLFSEPKEYKASKIKSLDLTKLLNSHWPFKDIPEKYMTEIKEIQQLEIVESTNGPKLVVLYCDRIHIIELVHNSGVKRKATSVSALKKKRVVK